MLVCIFLIIPHFLCTGYTVIIWLGFSFALLLVLRCIFRYGCECIRQQVWISTEKKNVIITQTHTYSCIERPVLTGCEQFVCVCVYLYEWMLLHRCVKAKTHNATIYAFRVWPLYVCTPIYVRYISDGIAIISMPFDSLFAFCTVAACLSSSSHTYSLIVIKHDQHRWQ